MVVILFVFLLVASGITLIRFKKKKLLSMPKPLKAPVPVKAAVVKRGKLEVKEHYLGVVKPLRYARISTRLTGYIFKLSKYEGDVVRKGEVLVEVDARQLRARLSSLKAQLKAAEEELTVKKHIYLRNKTLIKHQAVSQEEFELSKSAFELARAQVKRIKGEMEEVETELSYAVIKAPFSGVVTARLKEPGELAVSGSPILEIEDPSAGYRLLVNIPQEKAILLKKGGKAYITDGSKVLPYRIYKIHPAVGKNALAVVEIRLKERPFCLPSGSSLGVDLVLSTPEGFIVPTGAVVPSKRSFVHRIANGILERVPVDVLAVSGDYAVCSGDLREGDLVVVGDPGLLIRLHPGQRVKALLAGKDEHR